MSTYLRMLRMIRPYTTQVVGAVVFMLIFSFMSVFSIGMISPFLKALFREPNPGPMKALMESLGLPAGEAMLPLMPPSDQTIRAVKAAIEELLAAGKMSHLAA